MTIAQRASLLALAALTGLTAAPASAQVLWDSTGNSLLNGTYNYREVIWLPNAFGSNTLDKAVTQYGTITFDGNGGYRIQASVWDSDTNSLSNFDLNGTYSIAASGFGFITRSANHGGIVYGSVSHDVFIGSSTESDFNTLFIAARADANALTTASFNTPYLVAYMNFPNLNEDQARDASYRLTPNGTGGLAPVNLTGFIGTDYTAVNQTINNATYAFNAGVGTLHFGGMQTAQNLLAGDQMLYASPDGEFIFGGSANGWDMFVGVRQASNVPSGALDRLFYTAGVDLDRSYDVPVLDAYFGSIRGLSQNEGVSGNLVGHQRVLVEPNTTPYDYNFSDFYSLAADGSHDDFLGYQYELGSSLEFRIGYGAGDLLGIAVGVAAPELQGPGVYVNPMGVVNGASYTPFTAGLAPGTLVTMFGSGFADGNDAFVDPTFPTTLGGVQVMVNGRLAPVYVVTASQISFVLPYETEGPVGEIRVVRNGTMSNRVTFYVNETSPGIFTVPPTGLEYAAALHADYSLITPQNPARAGETIQVFLTGLGAVDPPVAAGTPGPTSPFSTVTAPISASIDALDALITYAGLAPQLPGLYQLNVEVPAGVRPPDVFLEVAGPGSFNTQVLLPVGNALSDARAAAPVPQRSRRAARPRPAGRKPGAGAARHLDFRR